MIDIITTVFLVGAGLYFLVVYCYQHVLKPARGCPPGFSENKEGKRIPAQNVGCNPVSGCDGCMAGCGMSGRNDIEENVSHNDLTSPNGNK